VPVLMRVVVLTCVLLPPTICMGGTLPALTRHVSVLNANLGVGFSVLYGINTLGALTGCLVAGFLLLPFLGERMCMGAAATANAAIVLCSWACVRIFPVHQEPVQRAIESNDALAAAHRGGTKSWQLYACLVLIGGASMACEVAWTRVMALVLGGSVYAFAALLAVFLGALGLGALLAA